MVRAGLTFDAGPLAAIDAETARHGLTGSTFLASAAREKAGAQTNTTLLQGLLPI
jgi:hypothetical protein